MKSLLNIFLAFLILMLSGCYSCQSWNNFWGKGPVEPGAEEEFFWSKDCKLVKPVPKPRPAPKPKPIPVKPSECGPYKVLRDYPCAGCGVVRVEKSMPSEVQLNAPFTYDIVVTNLTDMDVCMVVLTEKVPSNFKFQSAAPSAQLQDGKLTWSLGCMKGGEKERIRVTGMATSADCLKHCATVTYVVPACANVKVVQPKLILQKTAPSEVLLCDPIPVKIVVANTGTGATENVKITDSLPAGLHTTDGKSQVTVNVGTLAAGQRKQYSMMLKASRTGKYENKAVASASGGLKAEASTTTIVRQPVLAISKSAPSKRYLGRSVTYEIMVANKGDAAAKALILEDRIPTGARFVSASNGGVQTAGKVSWNLGTLAPGSSRKVSVTVMPAKAGTFTNTATAKATCAEGVTASARTSVEGIPAVLLEVIDIEDPIEIGSNDTYVITVTNQGSSPGTNIKIVCTLEDNMQYVSSSGATRGSSVGDTVTFSPLPSLAPKAKATWRVVIKAVKPGDVRFKVTMNTDQITRPVEETEATHLYQ